MIKSPLIVLPVYCQEEVDQFCWTMERWGDLTKTTYDYEFLIAMRFDFAGDSDRLLELCLTHAPTKQIRLGGSVTGFPGGSSEMWSKTMAYVAHTGDVSFAYWMEYDIMPRGPNWLNYLIDKWDDRFYIMGHFVSGEWLDDNGYRERKNWGSHINGAACYNPKISEIAVKCNWGTEIGWDVQLSEKIAPSDNLAMDLYDFRLNPSRSSAKVDRSKLLVHGVKTILEKQKVFDEVETRGIGLSLYGNDVEYTHGAIENCLLAKRYYPDWQVHIFTDGSTESKVLDDCRQAGAVIHSDNYFNMSSRFLVAKEVERFIIRDVDSRLCSREAVAVRHWINSGRPFHIMHDHMGHVMPIMGGLWGAVTFALPDEFINGIMKIGGEYNEDQLYLLEKLWPLTEGDCVNHRSEGYDTGFSVMFPNERIGTEFVGDMYMTSERQTDALNGN